jgi:hypothetical protein
MASSVVSARSGGAAGYATKQEMGIADLNCSTVLRPRSVRLESLTGAVARIEKVAVRWEMVDLRR